MSDKIKELERIHEILDIPVDLTDLLMCLGMGMRLDILDGNVVYSILVDVLTKHGVSEDECNRLTDSAKDAAATIEINVVKETETLKPQKGNN